MYFHWKFAIGRVGVTANHCSHKEPENQHEVRNRYNNNFLSSGILPLVPNEGVSVKPYHNCHQFFFLCQPTEWETLYSHEDPTI